MLDNNREINGGISMFCLLMYTLKFSKTESMVYLSIELLSFSIVSSCFSVWGYIHVNADVQEDLK